MNSNIQINLRGEKIPGFRPLGATISYGINMVPTAAIELDPTSVGLLCDFDSRRRSAAELDILTSQGCIHFAGLVDGLSFSQTPGGMGATLILKHNSQWLADFFPRIIGLHASSENLFIPQNTLQITADAAQGDPVTAALLAQIRLNLVGQDAKGLGEDTLRLNLIDFIIAMMIACINSQVTVALQPSTETGVSTALSEVLSQVDTIKNNTTPALTAMLNSINTSATKPFDIYAGSPALADSMLNMLVGLRDNIFANLTRLFGELGCVLVVGNRQAYVLPEATFLRIPKPMRGVQRGKISKIPNVIYPAEYTNIVFNDNGYVNVKGVYTIEDPSAVIAGTTAGAVVSTDKGVFIDPNAMGNILVTTMPSFISSGLVQGLVTGGQGIQGLISGNTSLRGNDVSIEAVTEAFSQRYDDGAKVQAARNHYLDQWAQMEYCRLKYNDRSGSISTHFRNNWAPGAVGTLYTREPGTYLDFFVNTVTHSFKIDAPGNGQANTTIGFSGGRIGATTATGLDVIDLYKYDYAKSQAFCQAFIADIT